MARVCDLCGKHAQNGYNVSHANNKTKKLWQPNLQSVRCQFPSGEIKKIRVCAQCIKSGRVTKPSPRKAAQPA